MNTIIDLMLAIREKCTVFYHNGKITIDNGIAAFKSMNILMKQISYKNRRSV